MQETGTGSNLFSVGDLTHELMRSMDCGRCCGYYEGLGGRDRIVGRWITATNEGTGRGDGQHQLFIGLLGSETTWPPLKLYEYVP